VCAYERACVELHSCLCACAGTFERVRGRVRIGVHACVSVFCENVFFLCIRTCL